MTRRNPTGHPARFSEAIIVELARILEAAYPHWLARPLVLDPCAGTGEALAELQGLLTRDGYYSFDVKGVEIEAPFIVRDEIVVQGDSTDPTTIEKLRLDHPTGHFVILTSPVYPNGVADSFIPQDASKRFTYIASLLKLTDDADYRCHPNNQAVQGYRGTLRHGASKRRKRYWELADQLVTNWAKADMVLLNVSDYRHSSGTIEPVVADWAELLRKHGWVDQDHIPVGTPRMRQGSNHEQRESVEVIIVAKR